MFILRRITSEHLQSNEVLGKDYSVLIRGQHLKFKETLELLGEQPFEEELYGFIVSNQGQEIKPLYQKSQYYVMTENGKTFENISYK